MAELYMIYYIMSPTVLSVLLNIIILSKSHNNIIQIVIIKLYVITISL